jgi:metacaspase-1
MSKGYSLHIGLNAVDPDQYEGWDGRLNACVFDAEAMEAIAKSRGFTTHKLIDSAATREAVKKKLTDFATDLGSGDMLLVTYSGHGGSVRDKNKDEQDSLDETWCLWNGQMLDDELYQHYGKFTAGVRIIVCSDSCHSGTITRKPGAAIPKDARMMPPAVVARVYRAHAAMYDALQADVPKDAETNVKASVLLISGCQDDEFSLDGPFNGAFTSRLLAVWDDGKFDGTYESFHKAILEGMPKTQRPNLFEVGTGSQKARQPFAI